MPYGILGLIVLILDIFVLMRIWSRGGDLGKQVLWTVLVLLLPLVGPILYLLMGNK